MPIRTSAAAVLLVAALFPGLAQAAKGGKGGGSDPSSTSSIAIEQTGPIHHGDAITFDVSTTATQRPFSRVECFRNGVRVYSSTVGHFDDYYDLFGAPIHHLNSLAWPSGEADCSGSLVYEASNGRWRTLASVPFHVDP